MSDFGRTLEGTTLCFAPKESITAQNAQQLRDEINESLDGVTDVVFDCTDVTYISSAGLRVFLATQKMIEGKGKVRLVHASPSVGDVFRATKLATFIDVEED